MITHNELQTLLLVCHEALDAHLRVVNPQHMVEQLSEEILLKTATRPLPSYALLHASPEARQIFTTMIQKSDAVLTAEETRLCVLTLKVERELLLLQINGIKDTRYINNLLQNLLSFDLLVYSDRRTLAHLTGISLQTFQQGLNPLCPADELSNFTRAFTWLLSQCATRLREKGSSSNHHLYNSLTKVSLELHSKQCVSEINKESGPAHMINFYESTVSAERGYQPVAPRAAEYLDPYDSDAEADRTISFDKTNHGLGSGVYGLAALDDEQIQRKLKNKSNFKIVEIEHPLRLVDNTSVQESDRYTEVSKRLQRICDEIKNLRFATKSIYASRRDVLHMFFTDARNQQNLASLAEIFCNIKNIETSVNMMHTLLLEAIEEFSIHADSKMHEIVPMPINYLLIKLGFTGVVSTMNDRFNRGLIAIELSDSTDFSFVPIKKFTSNPNSPHPKLRKSPWGGRLTPALRSLSDDSSTSNERLSTSYGSPALTKPRVLSHDGMFIPAPSSPRASFFSDTPPPFSDASSDFTKPSPTRK